MDRLSALLSRFHITVNVAAPGSGNLLIVGERKTEQAIRIEFGTAPRSFARDGDEVVLLELQALWGGEANPLFRALHEGISLSMSEDDETQALVHVLLGEARSQRCGISAVLSRLGEIIFIRLIRAEVDHGVDRRGLLAGLADPRISKALVAIHEQPGRAWRNEQLAELAGLSLSRFAAVFHVCLGQTPQAYLRQWRMTLAHQDIQSGERIKSVSRRYGYASSEALARAFQRQFGKAPLAVRGAS